jgi:O-antigen/teichoic acid export membrane protein
MAHRLGRHSAIYAAGTSSALVLGLVQVVVLTRLLDLATFGQLAILLAVSALLTVAYNLGTLQGSMRYVFGTAGDDGIDEGGAVADEEAPAAPTGQDKRRALGTALALIALITSVGALAVALAAPALAELLLGDRDASAAVVWMAVSAGLGSVWRVATFTLRMERRPAAYSIVAASRPIFVVAAVTPLAAIGHGVEDVMAGIAIGTALSLALTLVVTRRSYRPAFSLEDAGGILRGGWDFVPIVLAMWVVHNADVLVLSRTLPDTDVGIYRVASRLGAVSSYVGSAFLMAWGPMARTPIYTAVKRERGETAGGTTVITYFALGMIGLLLALAVFADVVVRIAPPSYAPAANLVPVIALAPALLALMMLVYRVARFPRMRLMRVVLMVVSALAAVGGMLLLVPTMGTMGGAIGVAAGSGVGLVATLLLSRTAEEPLEIQYGRLAAALALAAGCLAIAKSASSLAGGIAPAIEIAALLAYPILLLMLDIVPGEHAAVLRSIAHFVLPQRAARARLRSRLDGLGWGKHAVLKVLIHDRRPHAALAERLGVTDEEVLVRFVDALADMAGVGLENRPDPRIGACLLSTDPVATRDLEVKRLCDEGFDPLAIDALLTTLDDLRTLRASAWRRTGAGGGQSRPPSRSRQASSQGADTPSSASVSASAR